MTMQSAISLHHRHSNSDDGGSHLFYAMGQHHAEALGCSVG